MFVEGLDGFPGPYSSYVEETLGIERVHDIAADLADRRAAFRCVLGYCDGDGFAASPDPVDRGTATRRGGGGRDGEGWTDGEDGGVERGDVETLPVKLFEGYVPRPDRRAARGGRVRLRPDLRTRRRDVCRDGHRPEKRRVAPPRRALEKFAEWYADR